MSGSMLTRVKFPTLVKILTSEMSRVSDTLSSAVLEILMRAWSSADGVPVSGVAEGFVCSFDSAWSVAVSAGLAFRYDPVGVTVTGDEALRDHPWRLLSLRAATTVTLDAADPANDRIDLICVTDAETDARSTVVPIWNAATKTFSPTNKDLDRRNSPLVVKVTGVPDPVSPAVPATPAGYLALYEVTVPGGAADLSGATFTDAMTIVRGPGKLWADLVQKAGDTMTGALATTLVKVTGTGSRYFLVSNGNPTVGVAVDDNTPATPYGLFRGTGGGPGAWWASGKLSAHDGELHLDNLFNANSAQLLWTNATKLLQLKVLNTVANTLFQAGSLYPIDQIPTAPSAAQNAGLFKDLVPWHLGQYTAGSPPTVVGNCWNINAAGLARSGTGTYLVPFLNAAPGGSTMSCVASLATSGDYHLSAVATEAGAVVYVRDGAGSLTNDVVNFVLSVHAMRA
jgi:hypothetical protein